MALTKAKKEEVITSVGELLSNSKMTVIAKYEGTPVKAMQTLRRDARQNNTTVKVIKNRLVKQALSANDKLKEVDSGLLEGMLLYAFNTEDEVAPAQSLHNFAKQNPSLVFVGAISASGEFLDAESVKALAVLPNKTQLIAGIINNLTSPLANLSGSLNTVPSLLQGLEAKAS